MTRVAVGLVATLVAVSVVTLTDLPGPISPTSGTGPASRSLPVWIDTDPAVGLPDRDVDDGLALLQAFNAPELTIRGISVVFGNASLEEALPTARFLVERFGPAGLEVYPGAATAAAAGPGASETPAVRALSAALRLEPLAILALGPVTNIAALLERYPDLTSRIRSVVVVAGRRPGQRFTTGSVNSRGHPDFNFEMDPDAFAMLLGHQVPVVLVPFELSSRVWLTRADLDRLAAGAQGARWIARASKGWLDRWHAVFEVGGFNPFGTLAVAYLTHPTMLQCTVQPVIIDTALDDAADARIQGTEAVTKPYLIVGPGLPTLRTATYCYDVDPGFKEMLLERLGAAPGT